MEEKVRDLIKAHQFEINLAVSSNNRKFEDTLIQDNLFLNIPEIPQSYRRYGYGLLSYISKKLVFDWFKDYDSKELFDSVQSKITNSGMSAIDLTINTLSVILGERKIVAPKNIYFASDELIKNYTDSLFSKTIRSKSKEDLETIIQSINTEDFILFLETCSNTPDMLFYEEDEIMNFSEKFKYVVVDGSLIGLSRISPIIFKNRNVIYIESLSKNYHTEESSRITAGIVVYPQELEKSFQSRFYSSGCYLQLNDLMELHTNLYQIGKERIRNIAQNAQKFYSEAQRYNSKNLVDIAKVSNELRKIPLVIFLDFHERKKLKEYINASNMLTRGSFGHDETYILPIGLMWDSAPPGLARIAFGRKDYNPMYTKAFEVIDK